LKPRGRKKTEPKVAALLGVGLDGEDGHRRITHAEEVLLVGGSEETHQRMQETIIKVGEALERRGKCLRDTTGPELADLIRCIQK
jgi:hypothetical protein